MDDIFFSSFIFSLCSPLSLKNLWKTNFDVSLIPVSRETSFSPSGINVSLLVSNRDVKEKMTRDGG